MSATDQTQFFSEMLLHIHRIFTWIYSPTFEPETTNCSSPELVSYRNRNSSLDERIRDIAFCGSQPVILSDDLGFMWICMTGEDAVRDHLYMLGPVLPADASISGIAKQMQKSAMGKAQQDEVLAFLSTVPLISLTNIFQYAVMFAYTLSNQVYQISDIQLLTGTDERTSAETNVDDRQNARGNYAFQSFYLKLVEDGNLQYKELLNNYESIGTVGKLSKESALRNAKNTCIVTVALCGRAAMKGGLPPETAYSMSDRYIQAIDSAKSVSEVYAHNSAMLDDYIHKVHDHKKLHQTCSKVVADADAYIDLHLTEELSIERIARELGYSKYYFSTVFKTGTGKTVNEHIRDKRLEYAKMQLLTSDEKIAHLSEQLQFVSPSYFTKCFREYTGMTPNVFRKAKHT